MRILHSRFILFVGIVLVLGTMIISCGQEESTLLTQPQRTSSPGGFFMPLCPEEDSCSTADCINDFVDNLGGGCTLFVFDGTYSFTRQHKWEVNSQGQKNHFTLIGDSPRPKLTYCVSSIPGDGHAVFWAMEETTTRPTTIDNIHLDFTCVPSGKYAVEHEYNNAVWKNVKLTGAFDSRFYFTTTVHVDNLDLGSTHRLLFQPGISDGAMIKNSDLQGTVEVDENTLSANKTINFRDNSIWDVVLDAEASQTAKLAGNTFKAPSGASVKADSGFTMEADSNYTTKGRCECDADDDFSITGTSTLQLNSWFYQDTLWCQPEVEPVSSSRSGNTVTVTWDTDCVTTSKVIWGYDSGSLTNTATGSNGTSHSVDLAVAGDEGCVYFKAISQIPGCSADVDTSAVGTNTQAIVISNVQRTWDPGLCQAKVTWTTNVKSNSVVVWGPTGCSGNTESDSDLVTSHTVFFTPTGISQGQRIYIKVQSANDCDSAESSCKFVTKGLCL